QPRPSKGEPFLTLVDDLGQLDGDVVHLRVWIGNAGFGAHLHLTMSYRTALVAASLTSTSVTSCFPSSAPTPRQDTYAGVIGFTQAARFFPAPVRERLTGAGLSHKAYAADRARRPALTPAATNRRSQSQKTQPSGWTLPCPP